MADLTKVRDGVTLAQRITDARILLHVHGYLRDSESDRIRDKVAKDWAAQTAASSAPFNKPAHTDGCTEDCQVDDAGYCEHAGFIQNAPAHGEGL